MPDFFQVMEPLLRAFWFVAIPASVIFLVQTIMTFIGADASDGVEADFDGNLDGDAPFQLFSFRNLINFLLGFSWTGISFFHAIDSNTSLILLSAAVGAAFVYGFFLIIKQIHRLAEDNSFRLENTLMKTAEVYLRIPARKSGKGKILVSVNGSMHELEAMTETDEIPSGETVRITRIVNENILLVEKF